MALATVQDVVKALRRPLTSAEASWVPDSLEEATILVIGHLGCDPTIRDDTVDPPTETVPDAARIVTARMVARLAEQLADGAPSVPVGADSYSTTTGPFGQTVKVQSGSNTGGPWLAAVDKIMLKPLMCSTDAYAVDTAPSMSVIHSPECSANAYANAPYWQAYCTCGAALAGTPTQGVG